MKKICACIVSVILALGSLGLGGCGETVANDENTLEIQYYERGYGSDGINALIDAFKVKHPEINISATGLVDTTLASDIYNGISTVDLYFNGDGSMFNLIDKQNVNINGVSYESYFEPLTEVYEYIPEGESVAIKDKLYDDYEQFLNVKDGVRYTEDTYYSIPWMGGYVGLIYNSKMFETYGWTVPNTTDELVSLCDKIIAQPAKSTNKNSTGKDIKIAAFCYASADSYWGYVTTQWWAQYDGMLKYSNYWKGMDENGIYTSSIAASTGRLEMLKVLDSLIGTYTKAGETVTKRTNIYCDPTLSSRSYIDTQATFLSAEEARVNTNGATTAAMLPNGDWLESEMYVNYSDKIEKGEVAFKCMQTPVISSIINHPDCENTIADDAELSALIKAIDAGSTAIAGEGYNVSQKAFDKIKEARTTQHGYAAGTLAFIPIYATAKKAAKEFLKFMYSDEGIRIMSEATKGQTLPCKFDYSTISSASEFQKSKFEILSRAEHFAIQSDRSPIVYRGGLKSFNAYSPLERKFNASSAVDYMDPQSVFIGNYTEVDRLWSSMMKDAGIS